MRSPFSKKKKPAARQHAGSAVSYETRSLPAPPKPPHTRPALEKQESYDQSLNPFSEDNEEDGLVDSDPESLDNRVNESLCRSATASAASSRESLSASTGGGGSLGDSMDSGLDESKADVECRAASPDTPDTLKLDESSTSTTDAQNQQLVLQYSVHILHCEFCSFSFVVDSGMTQRS